MDQTAIKKYLGVIRRACDLIEQQLDAETTTAFQEILQQTAPIQLSGSGVCATPRHEVKIEVPQVNVNDAVRFTTLGPPQQPDPAHLEARKRHVESLMAIDCWPPAVPPHAVGPTSESDQINRAKAVLDFTLGGSIEGAHFLDFGCGEGYIAAEAALRGCAEVTGYDLEAGSSWSKLTGVRYTRDKNSLKREGYDLVFLYDVLDHCQDPKGVMNYVKSLVVPGGTVYVRCHPWISKHGSHLPKIGLNKAFIHLFLTYEELVELGHIPMFTRTEKDPLEAYHWWIDGFKVKKETIQKAPQISDFFHVPAFKDLLANEQEIDPSKIDGFMEMMKMEFVDFVLERPKL